MGHQPSTPQEFLHLFADAIKEQPILSASELSAVSIERHWDSFRDDVKRNAEESGCGYIIHLHEHGADSEPSRHVPPGEVRYINHTEVADPR